jgi:cytochrome c-type biogenesis protein
VTGLSGWAAFSAGLLSFLSPCVLPLVPGYISFMTGLSLDELSEGASVPNVRRAGGFESLMFVLGFTVVFTALGASATFVGGLLNDHLTAFSRIAGIIIILFGLHLIGLVPIHLLYRQKRASLSQFTPGLAGSFLMGLAFAFGWTPCIGPILSAILALAATEKTVAQGVLLLVAYSIGLGIPFIVTGFAVNAFMGFFKRYKPFIRYGEMASGLLLIVVGAFIFSGRLTYLIRWVPAYFKRFAQ